MEETNKPATGLKSFSKNFWTVIVMEFFERGSYYGVLSILAVYLVNSPAEGGLGFTKESVGTIMGTIQPLLYFLPIFAGALADRFGYRRTLMIAFTLMSLGYFFTSQSTTYVLVFMSLILMAVGAGFFKPIISGTIARETDERNSSLGFGIYYWSINLGAFIVPLLLVPYLKTLGWHYIFIMAAIGTGAMLVLNIFVYKEPYRPETVRQFSQIFKDIIMVLSDYRFIIMIVIYSGFWVLYFQMYGGVLWYLKDYVDVTPINNAVNSFLSLFVQSPNWKFDVEHVTVVNAGVIILLQLIVSRIVNRFRALPVMIFGIALGTIGMAVLSLSSQAWVFIAGIMIFTLGEMTAHPKFISYVGLIAPPDKKALYLGYSFLYGVIGSSVGSILGARLYVHYVDEINNPSALWLLFSLIGVATIIGLLLYNRFLAPKKASTV